MDLSERHQGSSLSREGGLNRRPIVSNTAMKMLVFAISLLSLPCEAQSRPECQLSLNATENLKRMSATLRSAALFLMQGLVYLDSGCLVEADMAFERFKKESVDTDDLTAAAATNWANYLLDLSSGYRALKEENLSEAITIFLRCSDEALPSDVYTRAIFALSEVLVQHPDSHVWEILEPRLKLLDDLGYWRARRFRAIYQLTPANGLPQIRSLESRLEARISIQERLEDEIILAEVLDRAGRQSEAALVTQNIERDVGEKAMSRELRIQYVWVCHLIASHQSRTGDADQSQRIQRYQSALSELYASQ